MYLQFRAPFGLCCAALALCAPCSAARAFETYQVTGVAAGDTLVVREEPIEGGKPADWKELGSIPSDAKEVLGTGRSKSVGAQRWLEVTFESTRGWVNARFLEGTDPVDLTGETFNCFGTEPFWGVSLEPHEGEYDDTESKTRLTTERVQPATARLFPLLYRLTDDKGQKYQATVSHQTWCSDGMSEYDYSFQVLLTNQNDFQQGCCVLKR
jgi:uncharacterized membrane protein